MRMLIGCARAAVLLLAASSGADDKIDAKKLVGKWEREAGKDKDKDKGFTVTVEYTADGKLMAAFGDFKIEGTYKVEGNKISQTTKLKDKEQTRVVTVLKLTDDALETEDDKGTKNTFKKVKDDKKKD